MKKAVLPILMILLITSVLLPGGCSEGIVKGSGDLVTEEMDFRDFTQVEVGHAFEVEITRSDSYHVSITADDNVFEYVQVSKKGRTLKIGLKPALHYVSTTLRAEITMPDLYELYLSGATRGAVQGFSSSHEFILDLSGASRLDVNEMSAGDIRFDISGASKVSGDITAGDAGFDVSGASTVQLQGSADDTIIEASGASRVELDNFPVNNADIKLSGASRGTVNLDGRLNADLSGASKLSYIGEPTMGDIETSGGSTLSKK